MQIARLEDLAGFVDHFRVAAQHHTRMLRRQFKPCRPLQLAILDQRRNPLIQRPRVLFTGHHGNELQLARVLGQIIALFQPGNFIHIGQLLRFAH
ncbi:hypothetical protein D3C76_1231140 [compost metagenome]